MTKSDLNSCQTAEAIGRQESGTNLTIDFEGKLPNNDAEGGNTTDGEKSDTLPDTGNKVDKQDEEYIRAFLIQYAWYHGMMFGEVAEKLLKWENSYLVRRAIKSTNKFLCVSARVDDKVCHFQLFSNNDGWVCPKLFEKFPRIPVKRYVHIYQLLDAWSLIVNFIVPVGRHRIILQHSSIVLDSQLGRGAFGEVYKAKYTATGATEPIDVAAKRLIGDGSRLQLLEFCHEASVMALLGHHNVVALYGFASLQHPIMLVMELVPGGDLKKYLRNTPNIPNKQIMIFAVDIANGMCHLASKKVIHRDLAARNCLITNELHIKISDFGLSVNDHEVKVKNLKKAPIRWLAPETLAKGIFNEKTDVWAFGVVCTELMTRCANDPLWPRDLKGVQKFIKESDHPHRIENGEPRELAEIVDACCEKSPSLRINFHIVRKRVGTLQTKVTSREREGGNSPRPSADVTEKKKSENRKSSTDRRGSANRRSTAERKTVTHALTKKKSKDSNTKKVSTERRLRMALEKKFKMETAKRGDKIFSSRRRESKPPSIQAGKSPKIKPH